MDVNDEPIIFGLVELGGAIRPGGLVDKEDACIIIIVILLADGDEDGEVSILLLLLGLELIEFDCCLVKFRS